jgi:predicted ATPase/class 3 adenylate cyclase
VRELPTGTVTFLFTDVEGSTRLLAELGAEPYAEVLAEHRRVIREACGRHGGVEVDTQGDAFFFAFAEAKEAVAAAEAATRSLAEGAIRVRMGVHTGQPHLAAEGYVGGDVHLAARVAASAHGGQVVLTDATRAQLDNQLELLQLGEHRLKDMDTPVVIFQLGDRAFPPLRTIANTNLPRPASSFVGREREVAELVELLREDARLVTLTGPGGTGKTRLAIEAAAEMVGEFKAGVFWVGLAALRDPALVLETISQNLGANQELKAHVGEREMLLLLDNLEQVIHAAPELAALVEACPNLALVVTSRELLRVRGEVEYQVLPLAEADAVDLFRARAQVEPSAAVEELCRRLDNMPLALELAAARTGVLTVEQILDRLSQRLDLFKGDRDADPRQATLRATIEWSHDLLSAEEQQLFARLAVFAGGCSLEAAEDVAGAALDTLQSLVEKSLVRRTGERLWMLETIREYALERLQSSGEASASRGAHAQYYLDVVEDLEPRFRGGDGQEAAFRRLDAELDNLRAALQVGLDTDPDLLVRLVAGAGYYLVVRGHDEEARRWSALASQTGAGTAAARGRVLRIAGRTALNVRDIEAARRFYGEALASSREGTDSRSLGEALRGLGDIATSEGDSEGARSFYEQALRASEAAGHGWSIAAIFSSLANLALTESRWEEAYALSSESVKRSRAIGDRTGEAAELVNVGLSSLRLGRRTEAQTALFAVVARDVADPESVAAALDSLAWLLAEAGHPAVSAEVLGASAQLFEQLGTTRWAPEQAVRNEALGRLSGLMGPDELEEALRRGRDLSPEGAARLALAALAPVGVTP